MLPVEEVEEVKEVEEAEEVEAGVIVGKALRMHQRSRLLTLNPHHLRPQHKVRRVAVPRSGVRSTMVSCCAYSDAVLSHYTYAPLAFLATSFLSQAMGN